MQGIGQMESGVRLARPATAPSSSQAVRRQSNLRLAVGWVLLVTWIVSAWALDWDGDWHSRVGRDGFWTPPHLVFYGTVAACGLICIGMVLLETFLYYRRYPGFNDQTTTPILFFRGPVGFALAGFGMAVMLGSAPLDDYWHRLFGIDVKVWAPFHVMLLLGIIMASLGILYLFASEVTRRRKWQTHREGAAEASLPSQLIGELRGLFHPAMLGLSLAAVFLMTRYLFLMGPDTSSRGTLQIAGLYLPAYSLIVLALPIVLVALVGVTGRFGIATVAGLLFLLFRLVDAPLINWGVNMLVQEQRRSGVINEVTWTVIYPVFLPLVGLAIDLIFLATRRWRTEKPKSRRNLIVAMGASLVGGVMLFLLEKPWEYVNGLIKKLYQASGDANATPAVIESQMFKPDYWAALPLVVVIAALAGLVGWALATSLRYTQR